MPKRKDIKKILIIGAGPIVIGQACEFDYSGAQACKALREEGYKVILVNSNPATIMTDPDIADKTYVEPITAEFIKKIIKIERPDALLPTMGGQTGINVAIELHKLGILHEFKVEMIGAKPKSIELAENRKLFNKAMGEINLKSPKSKMVSNITNALKVKKMFGLPLVIRPSFTLGGTGGGVAYNHNEFLELCKRGINASPSNQILIEKSVAGWKEYEMEVVRDKEDNCIIVCSIENVDPMGIHTGDSITVAPALTLTDKEYQFLRTASINVLRKIGVDTGGSNVQFAVNPKNGEVNIIEMNPRVSRSSALASKATGFPIAKIAAKLAVGFTLNELKNDITKTTPASFEPSIDYIVTKIPRFTFEKFTGSSSNLTTSMKSVGEAMSIGRNFRESLQKGFSSLEYGFIGLDSPSDLKLNRKEILKKLKIQSSQNLLTIGEAIRLRVDNKLINKISKYDLWFINQINNIISIEKKILKNKNLNKEDILYFKKNGFSDKKISQLTNKSEIQIRKLRQKLGIRPVYRLIDTCAGEFPSKTPYLYSTYDYNDDNPRFCESSPTKNKKIIILGGGPNRIGQGIEFDYCCVHAAYAIKELGIETIMVNCNPETVSTDYDTSDRLYFEPVTTESIVEIYNRESERGKILGVIVQFGGQTPLKIANELIKENIKIIGTSNESINLAEDRNSFTKLLNFLKIQQPRNGVAKNINQAKKIAEKISYPVLIRPSYVLGGRAMEIVYDERSLKEVTINAIKVSENNPILIDQFLENAKEIDVDLIRDNFGNIFIAGIMEHIEEAGIHSGDSTCSLPPYSLNDDIIEKIKLWVTKIAHQLKVVGLMNCQLALKYERTILEKKDNLYILEVNPRASRTVPFVAKATGIPIAKIAAKVMAGESLKKLIVKYSKKETLNFSVKAPVFPFNKFDRSDLILGPEMKSTGEVMGMDISFLSAFAKSQIAAGINLPKQGNVFLSVKDKDKYELIPIATKLIKLGFKLLGTVGTTTFLRKNNIKIKRVNKISEGSPHIVDFLNENKISLVINTTYGKKSMGDSYIMRRTTLMTNTPYYTTIVGANAAVESIEVLKNLNMKVRSLQSIH
ncbi:MAG: carbamoyl phosphate synthase large subunit [Pelagibacteraceae bacterium]|nr:carbamoyl phosphate synthase large subunit [Pelagibacteraceae bacterium]PPR51666.1 MAG: Carbamoyl-phosphate synthase large chain [Alphaproteobacteria bacterium MarineAlpha5_Bin10]